MKRISVIIFLPIMLLTDLQIKDLFIVSSWRRAALGTLTVMTLFLTLGRLH